MNPLFSLINNQNGGPVNNFSTLLNRFNQFKAQFQGNPQEQVQQLLNSGQMSQAQFNQLSELARQFQNSMKR